MTRPPVTLVMFGGVRPSHVGAEGSAWELARHLEDAGRLARVVCVDHEPGGGIPAARFASPPRRPYALAARLIEGASGGDGVASRRRREQLFDWWVSRSRALREAGCVVFRKPGFARSARMLRARGVPSLAIASICHPRMNFDRVGEEAARLGIEDHSPYRDERRVALLEDFFAHCDRILTTEHVGAASFAAYGIPGSRIVTTPLMNGADCERFRPRDDGAGAGEGPLRFLHLSAMNLVKGVARLLEAWRDLAPTDAELVLAGPMDESARIVYERIAPPATRWIGPVEDSPACYREADVFVSPSLSDSAPNTVLEALASGLPVVCSDACGASRLIRDGENGFVHAWNDTAALRDRLRACIEQRASLPRMGRAARETALANPRGSFAERVLDAVDASLATPGARSGPGS